MSFNFMSVIWQSSSTYFLITFLAVIILTSAYLIRFKKKERLKNLLVGKKYTKQLLLNYSFLRQRIKLVLSILALLFVGIACLRPQWGVREQLIKQQGRDLLVALDISRSMLAQDVSPNRIEVAKKKIKELVSSLDADRVGLILFAGSAVLQCPLTSDRAAFSMFLDSLDNQIITSSTTALDAPITKALEIYKNISTKKNKLLVIFTDGEDFSGNLNQLRKDIQDNSLHVFTMGIGTIEGAPVPQLDLEGKQIGHERDRSNEIVISRLNEDMLRLIAEDFGGEYISYTTDDEDVKTIISYIKKYEKEFSEEKNVEQLEERYYYFILIALVVFLLDWFL